jgi:hypothetical protein
MVPVHGLFLDFLRGSFVVQFVGFVYVIATGKRGWHLVFKFVVLPGSCLRVVYCSRGFNHEFQFDW